jgi:alpha-glucosidase
LPVAANPARINVAAQCDDPTSMLTLYRRLIALRKAEPALTAGAWSPLTETLTGTFTGTFTGSGDGFAYVRRHGERRLLVALNMGPEPIAVPLPNQGEILLSTHLDREGETVSGAIDLRAHEGVVVRLAAAQK